MQNFAEVILPLPLAGTYTYAVPEEMMPSIDIGSRVYVQFGRRKYYTGIVESLHNNPVTGYGVKPIIMVLDNRSIVRNPQIKFWKWIADYYLCSLGEVYRAGVPTGLKIESETFLNLNKEFEAPGGVKLTENQRFVVQTLEHLGKLSVKQLAEKTRIDRITPIVAKLLDMGIIEVCENAVERYRPEKKTFVRLTIKRGDDERLHEFFNLVTRSRKQEKMLVAYLELSRWLNTNDEPKLVEKSELLEKSGCSPAIFKSLCDKGIFESVKTSVNRFNTAKPTDDKQIRTATLSPAQRMACSEIINTLREKNVTLLHGVTGSGKTEIYTHLIEGALNDGNQVLYLVPEISLTTQLTDRLRAVFGDKLLVYHSKFSDNERVDLWNKVLESRQPMVILGVRSSVFLPFFHLGLIIVDEEHESSYKQYDPAPRYNARDAAIVLASMHGAKTVLGSATPSVETYFKATTGKYGLVELKERYSDAVLPEVEIVDMRLQRKKKLNHGSISQPLYLATKEAMESDKQAIMFQNRRGFAPMVVCAECGWVPKCSNCDVSLVYHKNINQLSCHYCGWSMPLPPTCPACGLNTVNTYGYGTERIAEEFHENFPDSRVARMDLDTTRNKNAYSEIIDEFSRHETDILIGTQMVSKGLDFENVNLVGVINADTLLNFPDFRSDERAFNMLEQVAGRAGRRSEKGLVIIQTTSPDNETLAHVVNHDYAAYYKDQLRDRMKFSYPPFTKVINIYLKNKDARTVDSLAVDYVKTLQRIFGKRVLGPEQPTIGRVATWYIRKIMLKVEINASMKKVKEILRQVFEKMAPDPRMKSSVIYYDVDPV